MVPQFQLRYAWTSVGLALALFTIWPSWLAAAPVPPAAPPAHVAPTPAPPPPHPVAPAPIRPGPPVHPIHPVPGPIIGAPVAPGIVVHPRTGGIVAPGPVQPSRVHPAVQPAPQTVVTPSRIAPNTPAVGGAIPLTPPAFVEVCDVFGVGTVYVDATRQVVRPISGTAYEVVGQREAPTDPVACSAELILPHKRLCEGRDGALSNREDIGPPPAMGTCRLVLR